MLDSRPARYPLNRWEIERDDVEARKQDAVQGARRSNKIGSAYSGKHGSDHCVDRRRLDAHVVAAALLIGGRGPPVEQLLVARRKRLFPAVLHHVDIKGTATALDLVRVDRRHARLDANPFQMAYKCEREPLLVAGRSENLEREWLAGADIGQLRAFEVIAGSLEKGEGPAKVVT